MSNDASTEIFAGDRTIRFKNLIAGILKRANLTDEHIARYTTATNMAIFSQAFTAASADDTVNYEMFEQLGDVTANKFIVWYMYRRFPQLKHPLGVKVVARLRINYGARQTFNEIGEKLGFWDFISASVDDRARKKKDLLEDCVESIVGAIEFIIDEDSRPGVGNAVAYDILKSVFDEIDISLGYEDLYDAKTRLKELFDFHKGELGKLVYTKTRDEETGIFRSVVKIQGGDMRVSRYYGTGTATKLKDAEQYAAGRLLEILNSNGISKPVPPEYAIFNTK
jgi:dsRNA-specific ribonuclease